MPKNFFYRLGLGVLGVALLGVAQTREQFNAPRSPGAEQHEADLFQLVQKERAARGIPPLRYSESLARVARRHSERMREEKKVEHELSGEKRVVERIAEAKLYFSASAENVAREAEVALVHAGLMRSDGHRANILNARYTDIGIGVAADGDGQLYVTQDFIARLDPQTDEELTRTFLATLNRVRTQQGLFPFRQAPEDERRAIEAARAMRRRDQVRAQQISQARRSVQLLAFTLSNLTEIPPPLVKVLKERSDQQKIILGVAFGVSKSFPNGIYWCVAELW